MEDHQIIELYFARDELAIEETAKRYGGVCMQVSMDILRDRMDAEECVNDTYLKAFSEESGVQSYGEVADYLIAWYLQK